MWRVHDIMMGSSWEVTRKHVDGKQTHTTSFKVSIEVELL